MLYLLLAIACSTTISVCMRLSEKYNKNQMVMFVTNYAVCVALSRAFAAPRTGGLLPASVWLGCIGGVLYLLGLVYMRFNMRRNGIVLAATFSKLGVLVPTLMAIFVYREQPAWTQIVGFALALAAILILQLKKDPAAAEGGWAVRFLLPLQLLISGVSDAMANIYEQTTGGQGKDDYLFFVFGTALVLAAALTFVRYRRPGWHDVLFGVLIGVPNYFSARFLLAALGSVPAVVAYPVYSVGTLVAITLAGVFLFRERLGRRKLLAIGLIVLALALLNM